MHLAIGESGGRLDVRTRERERESTPRSFFGKSDYDGGGL